MKEIRLELLKPVLRRKWSHEELEKDLNPIEFGDVVRKEIPDGIFETEEELENYIIDVRECLFEGFNDDGTITDHTKLPGLGSMSRKAKCAACIAANTALAVAITVAVVKLLPELGVSAAAAAIAAKFGVSLSVASAAVEGAKAAYLAYKLCKWC